ncbi:biotin--[acetyl-CoA-carboxylase] ligase [Niveispirillum lacus]|uniref:biotin--[biotin carboxyl-carrier protein] ligase n=1 Tax=Niveispirillum lacus TaxID=1981099 RepID=A0A255YVX8_9PROT|nr:biotin--[acetyl-CoA-carboxylase] ligase [Niveispirillum lacus]OYQ33406.1 biotin--[acetyl-CoA-carboxylase] ligase [Niveispirillum lacus]
MESGQKNRSDETRAALLPAFFHLHAVDECGSTNDVAKQMAGDGAPEGTLVWALRQTAGRGRRGRAWSSEPGNLACSLILRPSLPAGEAALTSFVAAVAVGEAVSALVPGKVTLKWPNDVLVDGAKISGILLESEAGGKGSVDWLVLGVGINVRHCPAEALYPATSMLAAGADVSVEHVLTAYAGAFEVWYQRFLRQGFAPIRAAWLNAAQGLGGAVTIRLQDEAFTGRLVDMDEGGVLIVETGGGVRRITAGDVFFPGGGA